MGEEDAVGVQHVRVHLAVDVVAAGGDLPESGLAEVVIKLDGGRDLPLDPLNHARRLALHPGHLSHFGHLG